MFPSTDTTDKEKARRAHPVTGEEEERPLTEPKVLTVLISVSKEELQEMIKQAISVTTPAPEPEKNLVIVQSAMAEVSANIQQALRNNRHAMGDMRAQQALLMEKMDALQAEMKKVRRRPEESLHRHKKHKSSH